MFIDYAILGMFFLAALTRVISLLKSVANERILKKKKAIEYGRRNSKLLLVCHTLFYLSCLAEAIVLKKQVSIVSFFGAGLFIFSMSILLIVIYKLRGMWTVKLIIAPEQSINKSFLFKYIRHPNYFLNIIPELISIALICQARYTLLIGLPVYLIPLIIRIVQEEKVMKMHFSNY